MANRGMQSKTIAYAIWVYECIRQHVEDEGGAPSIRELMVMVDVPGSATIQRYLRILREWGWIDCPPFEVRSIRLTRPTETIVERPKSERKKRRHAA